MPRTRQPIYDYSYLEAICTQLDLWSSSCFDAHMCRYALFRRLKTSLEVHLTNSSTPNPIRQPASQPASHPASCLRPI